MIDTEIPHSAPVKNVKRKRIIIFSILFVVVGMAATMASFFSTGDLLKIGSPAPDFSSEASDGNSYRLSDYRGKSCVVLVFYPGDNTAVCTAQLCSFRDNWGPLNALNAMVFGVNGANKEKHAKFVADHSFPFPLLVDSSGKVASDYGCNGIFGIMKRTVYVIDKHGNIAWVQRGNPPVADVISALKSL